MESNNERSFGLKTCVWRHLLPSAIAIFFIFYTMYIFLLQLSFIQVSPKKSVVWFSFWTRLMFVFGLYIDHRVIFLMAESCCLWVDTCRGPRWAEPCFHSFLYVSAALALTPPRNAISDDSPAPTWFPRAVCSHHSVMDTSLEHIKQSWGYLIA